MVMSSSSTAVRLHPSLMAADAYLDAITGDAHAIRDAGEAARYALTTRPIACINTPWLLPSTFDNSSAMVVRCGAQGLCRVLSALVALGDGDGRDSRTLPSGWSDAAVEAFKSDKEEPQSAVAALTAPTPRAGKCITVEALRAVTGDDTPLSPPATSDFLGHLAPHTRLGMSLLGRSLWLVAQCHSSWMTVLTRAVGELPKVLGGLCTEIDMSEALEGLLASGEGLSEPDAILAAHGAQRTAWSICHHEILPSINLVLLGTHTGIRDVVSCRTLVEAMWSLLVPLSLLASIRHQRDTLAANGLDVAAVECATLRLLAGAYAPDHHKQHPSAFTLPLGAFMLLASFAGNDSITIPSPTQDGGLHSVPLIPFLCTSRTARWELQLADLSIVGQMLGRTATGAKEAWKALLTFASEPHLADCEHRRVNAADAASPIRGVRAQLESLDNGASTGSPFSLSARWRAPDERKALQALLGVSKQLRETVTTMLAPYLYSTSSSGLYDINAGSPILPSRGPRRSEGHVAEKSRSAGGVRSRSRLSGELGGEIGERRPREPTENLTDKRLRYEQVGGSSPLGLGRGSGVLGASPMLPPLVTVGGSPLPPLSLDGRRVGVLGDRLPPPPPPMLAQSSLSKMAVVDPAAVERASAYLASVDFVSGPLATITDVERFAVNRALTDLREQLLVAQRGGDAGGITSPADHLLTHLRDAATASLQSVQSRVAAVSLLEACMRTERHNQPDGDTAQILLPEDAVAEGSFISGSVANYVRGAIQPLVEESIHMGALLPLMIMHIQRTVNTFVGSGASRLCGVCKLLPLHCPLSYSLDLSPLAPVDFVPGCGGPRGRVARALQTAAALGSIWEAPGGLVDDARGLLASKGRQLQFIKNSSTASAALDAMGILGAQMACPTSLSSEALRFYASRGAPDEEVTLARFRMLCCGSLHCGACVSLDTCRMCGERDVVPGASEGASPTSSLIGRWEADARSILSLSATMGAEGVTGEAVVNAGPLEVDALFRVEGLMVSPSV